MPSAWLLALLSGIAASDGSDPYEVIVTSSPAEVRSGPARRYYATAEVERGTRLEVHRREAGGWLAIRPPADSFSWVAASDVLLAEGNAKAQVTGARVVSWIGSVSPGENHKWQVRLEPGEWVRVLGRGQLRPLAGSSEEPHYRIAPPAGEFRWVHEDDVRRTTRGRAVGQDREGGARDAVPARYDAAFATAESPPSRRFMARTVEHTEPVRVASRTPARRFAAADAEVLADEPFERRIRQLDLELALAITKPPADWNLAGIRREVRMLAHQATGTLQRARIQMLEEQLAECAALAKRYAEVMPASRNGPDPAGEAGAASGALAPRFDGRGWLLPVHSQKRNAPRYALLDDSGQILQFVSPAPGLNLHRYLRKQVGLFGQRRYLASLEKPHVTAHRVVDLSRHRR